MTVKNANRQSPSVAMAVITAAALADGLKQAVVELPGGAIVTGGFVTVTKAFDSSDAATLKLGDATVDNRYGAPDMKSTGLTALTLTGFVTPVEGDIEFTYTGSVPTEGEAHLVLEYIVVNRAEFTQG